MGWWDVKTYCFAVLMLTLSARLSSRYVTCECELPKSGSFGWNTILAGCQQVHAPQDTLCSFPTLQPVYIRESMVRVVTAGIKWKWKSRHAQMGPTRLAYAKISTYRMLEATL